MLKQVNEGLMPNSKLHFVSLSMIVRKVLLIKIQQKVLMMELVIDEVAVNVVKLLKFLIHGHKH